VFYNLPTVIFSNQEHMLGAVPLTNDEKALEKLGLSSAGSLSES
jgi:hypothetical protein